MQGNPPCRIARPIDGLHVTVEFATPSGHVINRDDMRKHPDVHHIVRIVNLRAFPADVECVGEIQASTPKIRFSSPNSGDTDTRWQDKASYPASAMDAFTHVKIIANSKRFGPQAVQTTVQVRWPGPGQTRGLALPLTVNL